MGPPGPAQSVMVHVIALFVILALSMIIVRGGGMALCLTGMSREAAMFQSQSAFMGVGFTTKEAESVVSHPVRRRIIRLLMLLGFISVTSTVSTLVVTLAKRSDDGSLWAELAALVAALVLLWTADRIPLIRRRIDRWFTGALEQVTPFEVVDYEEVLNLHKGYAVAHVTVEPQSWLCGRKLRDLRLADEGMLVLTIDRLSGAMIATPSADTLLHEGDRLLCYGRGNVLANIAARESGDRGRYAHEAAVRRHRLTHVEELTEEAEAAAHEEPSANLD